MKLKTQLELERLELELAFAKVRNEKHWKDPIHKVIEAREREIVEKAIRFYTATEPTFYDIGEGQLFVRAIGYRRGPAGDH